MAAQPVPSDQLGVRLDTLGDAIGTVPGVLFAYLFGSQSTGRAGPLSDVDVAVYLDDRVDALETKLALIDLVSRHVGSDRADVVVLNSAPIASPVASWPAGVSLSNVTRSRDIATSRPSSGSSLTFGSWNAGTSRDGTNMVDRELVLRKVAALEQYVVDDYARIDAGLVVRILRDDLGDLAELKRCPGTGLKNRNPAGLGFWMRQAASL